MSEYELEFLRLDETMVGLTFTPYGLAYAYNANNEFFQLAYTVDADGRLQLQKGSVINLKRPIHSFFVVQEASSVLVHCGTNVLLLNPDTFECKKVFENVTQLVPHHPGYEPVLVPLVPTQGTQTVIDLNYAPIHVQFVGAAKAAFVASRPWVNQQTGLYDFILVQDRRFSVITAQSAAVRDVCCQFGQRAYQNVVFDGQQPKPAKQDPYSFKYEFYVPLSNLSCGQAISDAAWVGDRLYLKSQDQFLALDLRQLSFTQQILKSANQGQLYDVQSLCQPIVSCSCETAPNVPLLQLLGANAEPAQLVQPVLSEVNRRLKRGISLQKYKTFEGGSTLYLQEKHARSKLQAQPSFEQLINDPGAYSFLQIQDSYCYGLLRDANQAPQGGIVDAQTVKQFSVMSNTGLHKTVETMCEQLETAPIKQAVPHCFVLMPVVLGLHLGTELYHIDSEVWKRQVKRNFGACKSQLSQNFGEEIIEVSQEQIYYQVASQINVLFKSQDIESILTAPTRADALAAQLQEVVDKQSVQLQSGSFILKFANSYARLVKKKYSQVLIRKLEMDEIQTMDQVISIKQEAQQASSSIQDKTEFSKIQTALGLMFFSQNCYMECINCFLQAKTLNPLSVCSLFLQQLPAQLLSNSAAPDRADQPASGLVERCQHFGFFKEIISKQFGDEHWQALSEKLQNPVTSFQQYCGLEQSLQEKAYSEDAVEQTCDQLLNGLFQQLSSPEQHSWELSELYNPFNNQKHAEEVNVRKRISNLAYYLRVYLDVKSNWIAPLRQVLQKCGLHMDRQFIEQFITPNVSLINNKTILRLDEQQLVLRAIFVLLLSAKPFQIRTQELCIFFLNKPEEIGQMQSLRRAPVMLSNPKIETTDFSHAIGLLVLFKYYNGASKLSDMLRQSDTLNYNQYTFTICLLNSFGVDEFTKESDWELHRELEQLKLDEDQPRTIFWQFLPYVCLKKPDAAVRFLQRQLRYKNQKTGEEIDQFIFFEKLTLKQWSQYPGYYKPQSKDEHIKDFGKTFTPEVVLAFFKQLRYDEIELKQKEQGEEYLMGNYIHHRALASLLLYQVSKCVQLAYDDYKRGAYNEEAPSWSAKVTKKWLGLEASQFLGDYISCYADNDDAQKWFAKAVMIHLEQMVQNYKKVVHQLQVQQQSSSSAQIQIATTSSSNETQQQINLQLQQLSQEQKPKKRDNESVISEAVVGTQQFSEHNSEFGNEKESSFLVKQLKQKLNAEELTLQLNQFQKLHGAFYVPYFSAAVKSGDTATAIDSLFVDCFQEAAMETYYQLVNALYKQDKIKTKISLTKQEQLQNWLKQVPALAGRQECTLSIQKLEKAINQCLTFCEPYMKTLVKQGVYDSIDKAIQTDCLEFLGLNYFGVKERSPVNLLYQLMVRFNIVFQCNLISTETFYIVLSRFMNTDTKAGEYLARYAAAQVLELLPSTFPVRLLIGFISVGFKLRQINNSELGIEKIKLECQSKGCVSQKQSVQAQSFVLNSFAICAKCNKPLIKQGQEMGKFVIKQEADVKMVHRECFEGHLDLQEE